MDKQLLDALLKAIKIQDDERAEQLVLQLTPTDEPALLAWLTDPDPDQRWWAARALANCGTGSAISPLLDQLKAVEPAVRAVSALALGHLYDRVKEETLPILDTLAAHLTDEDGSVRQAVADALIRCGEDALPALAQVLQGAHEGARTRAAYALRKIGSPKAAPLLFRCLNDPNYMVHTYAHEALDEMGLLENVVVML